MEQQREVYFWSFSLNVNEAIPCKQAENLKVFVQAGIMLRKEFKNMFSSVTDLYKGVLGTQTRDTGPQGETEGGRLLGKILLIIQP